MPNLQNYSPADFANFFLPRLHGPLVNIRINPSGKEYTVSRDIFVSRSSYFARMLGGDFVEGKEQTASIEELDDVLSVQSFEIILPTCSTSEAQIAQHLEETLNHGTGQKANFDEGSSDKSSAGSEEDLNAHICCLTSEDIRSVVNLHVDHPVRSVVAQASIRGFFSRRNCLFAEEIRQIPGFAADLLVAIRQVLRLRQDRSSEFYIRNPANDRRVYL
ncbi:hypothetical protein N7447_006245 [Penicillium robsamsonii]|uniref:uncharacterized protein n=1 Tax=Penicillium robsamsonii TaxID=1792511 RepID=UPI0025468DB6|nr:uncharacterized protein N7447_006245 [Penicillium robsamsonii]KAJ5823905.1 hypothetical protein N7447_006245 [Penicillium robsamsonii]